jgi:hypothetical protein
VFASSGQTLLLPSALEHFMSLDELNGKYEHLRSELDAAYAAPVWDSNRINLITEQLVPVELALASIQSPRNNPEMGGLHV